MYKFLGWLNVAVIVMIILPIVMQKIHSYSFFKSDTMYVKSLKWLRKLHKSLGLLLFIFIALHGFMALGSFRLHTGSLVGILFILTAVFAIIHISVKKKWTFVTHKVLAYFTVLTMIVHLIFPSAIYTLFGV